jgi:hypothetical protein
LSVKERPLNQREGHQWGSGRRDESEESGVKKGNWIRESDERPTHLVTRSQITGLKQTSWIEKEKNESMETLESVRYLKLELQGEKRIMLLNDQKDSEESDWLGRYLAALR